MKILLLGGTGAMGAHLVHLLAESNHDIVITSRSVRPPVGKIKYFQGDAHNSEFLKKVTAEHFDVIIDFMVYTTSDFKEHADVLLKTTKQYIFLSSARVYGNEEYPIIETSPRLLESSNDPDYLTTDEYALAKARQEDILRGSGYKNWTIIRPYITYSENRLQLGVLEKEDWLYRVLKGRTIIHLEDINKRKTTLTYGLDVAKGIVGLVGNSNAIGNTFHITLNNNESKTWQEIVDIYIDVLEKHLYYKPKVLLLNLNKFLTLRSKEGKYQVLYDRAFERAFDNTKIEEIVGECNFTKTETGLKKCLEVFLKNPQFNNIDWVFQAKMDRLSKEKASLREISGIKRKLKYLLYRYGLLK